MLAYVYMHNMGWGWGLLMTLGWLIILALLVGVAFAAIQDRRRESARDILDRRLAQGEISLDEYRRARSALSGEGPDQSPTSPPTPA
jgi:uncharacterized membrane protein